MTAVPEMPSKSKQVTVKCDSCAKLFQVTHWHRVDGIDNPELKRSILDGSLFVAKCDGCGCLFKLEQNIQYSELHHINRQTFAAYLVSAENVEKERGYIEFMPMYRKMGARIHVVNSPDELRHLIRSYDAGALPPETVIKASRDPEKNRQHDEGLSEVASSMDKLMSEIASGKMSQDTIDKIKRGRKLMKKNEQKVNLVAEVFEDPKKGCIALGALGCLLALLDMPEGFYVVLRFVVVAASIASIWLLQKSSHGNQFKTIMSLLLGILAVIFNPVMPLDLESEQWAVFNLAGAGLLLGTFFAARGKVSTSPSSRTEPIIPTPLTSSTGKTSGATPESRPKPPQPKEEKGSVFYHVLEFPPQGVKPTLANIMIKATASIERTKDGGRNYTLSVNDGAKPHDVLEAQAATFWKTELDEGRVLSEQAAAWIDGLCQATARQYWGKLGSDSEKRNETTLLVPLAKATVQYAFANAESLGLPISFVKWTKDQVGRSSDSDSIASGAEALNAAEKLGLLDPSFIAKLALCFSRRG